jgi:hypothetical protein
MKLKRIVSESGGGGSAGTTWIQALRRFHHCMRKRSGNDEVREIRFAS